MEETDGTLIVLRDWFTKLCGLSFRIADKLAQEFTDSGITEIDQFQALYQNNHDWLDDLECKLPRLTKNLINSVVEKIGRIPLQNLTVQDVSALLQTCYEGFDYYQQFKVNLINGFNLIYVHDVETLMEFGISHGTHAATLLESLNEWRRIGVPSHLVTLSDEDHRKRLLSIKSEQKNNVENNAVVSSTVQQPTPVAVTLPTCSGSQNEKISSTNTFINQDATIDNGTEETDAGTACSVEEDLESLADSVLVAPVATNATTTASVATTIGATTTTGATTGTTADTHQPVATHNYEPKMAAENAEEEENIQLLLCNSQQDSARKRKLRRIILDEEDEGFEIKKHHCTKESVMADAINAVLDESSTIGKTIPASSTNNSHNLAAIQRSSNKVAPISKTRLPSHALLSGELLARLATLPAPISSSLVLLANTTVDSKSSSTRGGLASTQPGRHTPSPPSSLSIPKNSPGHWEYHTATSPEGKDHRQLVFIPQAAASSSVRDNGNEAVEVSKNGREVTDSLPAGSLCLSEDVVGDDHLDFSGDLFGDGMEDSFSMETEEHTHSARAHNTDTHAESTSSGTPYSSTSGTRRKSSPVVASTDPDISSSVLRKRGRPRSSEGSSRADAPTPGSHSTRSTSATATSTTHPKESSTRYKGIRHACEKLLSSRHDKCLLEAMYAINDGFKRNKARGFVDVIVASGAFRRFLHFIHHSQETNQVVLYRAIVALCEISKRTDAIAEVRTMLQPSHFRALLKLLSSTNQLAREQALVLIGDIGIGTSHEFKQAVLAAGAITAIVKCFYSAVDDFEKSLEDVQHVQGRCVTAIYSLVSLSTPEQFHYFEEAIPILIAILSSNPATSTVDREHLADAIQSASFLITEHHPEQLDVLINTKLFETIVLCLQNTDSHDEIRWYACAFIWQFSKYCVSKQLRFLYRVTAILMHIFQYNHSDVHLRAAALNTLQNMFQRDEYFIQQFLYHRDNTPRLIVDYVRTYSYPELIHGSGSKAETVMKYASLTLIEAVLGANTDQLQRILEFGVYPLLFKITSLQGEAEQPEEVKLKAVEALKKLLITCSAEVYDTQIKAQKRDFAVTENWDIIRSLVSATIPPKKTSSQHHNGSSSSSSSSNAVRTPLWSDELRSQAREVLILANKQGLMHTL